MTKGPSRGKPKVSPRPQRGKKTKSSRRSKRFTSKADSWNQLRGIACQSKIPCKREPPKSYKTLRVKPRSMRFIKSNSYDIEGSGRYFAPTLWKGYLVFKRTNNLSYSRSRVKHWLGLEKYKHKKDKCTPWSKLMAILDRFISFVAEKLNVKFNYVIRLVKRVSKLLHSGRFSKLYAFLRKFIRPRNHPSSEPEAV